MKALLLIAHGSRRKASNQEVCDLAQRLEKVACKYFDFAIPAFLELAEPDIPTGVDHCVEAGATQVVAVPYFLAAGRHVVNDIPEGLAMVQRKHPELDLRQSDYLGRYDAMSSILLTLAQERLDQKGTTAS